MAILKAADIMLPQNVEYSKWSVVACDQYTSEADYWQTVGTETRNSPSAFNIIFPEVYLGTDDTARIKRINMTMRGYIAGGLFRTLPDTYIYLERTLSDGRVRKGVIGSIDLEEYDFHAGSRSPVRATEGVVYDRVPPRVKIREGAPLEIPHIMLLIDDPEKKIIDGAKELVSDFDIVYNFDLMQNSGHLKGWAMCEASKNIFAGRIENMEKSSVADNPLIYAVGDGNHSLAAAKEHWENIKRDLSEEARCGHPARYALVEVVNIHDDSLEFEPIHRILYNVKKSDVINAFLHYYPKAGKKPNDGHHIKYICGSEQGDLYVKSPRSTIPAGTLQNFLDDYIKRNNIKTDYIHGEDALKKAASKNTNMGFILPPMPKSDLFTAVMRDGALPRKTFSMGSACDKRFYLEAKMITR